MNTPLKLIVGIGNPGTQYADTRHNTGVWFVERLAARGGASFKDEKKFFGRLATINYLGSEMKLLLPTTYMNESGKSVGAFANFFKIEPAEMLIAHDELDLPTGVIRFKQGGGLAGHNGLRDISRSLGGSQEFNRVRIGVGHPGTKDQVTGHVLGKAGRDRDILEQCIDKALDCLPVAIEQGWDIAMNQLHTFRLDKEEGKEGSDGI